jgi:hypothetical protein
MGYARRTAIPPKLQIAGIAVAGWLIASAGCGSSNSGFPPGLGGGSGTNGGTTGTTGGSTGITIGTTGSNGNNGGLGTIVTSGASGGGPGDAGGDAVAPGDLPDPNCPAGVHTTVSGIVYDPSFQDPLYNITVYAPKSATLPVLPKGVGANSCSCDALYPPLYGSAVTDYTGAFKVSNVPPGTNVPIVVQTGKWRKEFMIPTVTKCVDNPQPDKTFRMPRSGTDGNLPDIAISTGNADSLECLLLRIGLDAGEWMGGPGAAGHVHIFHGNGANTTNPGPESYMGLWDAPGTDLMNNDITLLSCEGGETANVTAQSQQFLLNYANAGGRVFASHYHYSWFNMGPWMALNLATWYPGGNHFDPNDTNHLSFPGDVYTTLLNGGGTFPEGVALKQWLGLVMALDPMMHLQIYYDRHNADLLPPTGPAGSPSQPWIITDPSVNIMTPGMNPVANSAQYFSVDLPIAAAQKCGRVVYSDLHVSGGAASQEPNYPYFMTDYPGLPMNSGKGVVPSGCAMHPLTPQEKALEFMIFDLSSCIVPVGQVPRPPRGPA